MNTLLNNRQSGQALLIAMVLITLMAILSVTGLRSALLESRISDTQREQALAFQSAESVLTYGRNELVQAHLDAHSASRTQAVEYPVPADVAATSSRLDAGANPPAPQLTLRTLSRRGSLVSGQATANSHRSAWVELKVTSYDANGRATVALQEIVLRSATSERPK